MDMVMQAWVSSIIREEVLRARQESKKDPSWGPIDRAASRLRAIGEDVNLFHALV